MTQRTWDSVRDGEQLPAITDPISFTRVALAPAATLDWYPLHHDPEWARAHKQPHVVLSTIQLMGLVDRAVTEWAGPATFIRRRDIRLLHSVYANDVLTCSGQVIERHNGPDDAGFTGLVSVGVQIANAAQDVCCVATVTISLPADRVS